jgi:RNA polymerase sigma factor (TIGR02999 family)
MVNSSDQPVTKLLARWSAGDKEALDALTPLVYEELRGLARHYIRGERAEITLQGTALVHEAYMRLVDWRDVDWKNRAHFFGIAAQMMRRILVDRARERKAHKRGAGAARVTLTQARDAAAGESQLDRVDLLALDTALKGLEVLDPQQVRVVELRFFGGLSVEETAETLSISTATVKREWRAARAWLFRELHDDSRPVE